MTGTVGDQYLVKLKKKPLTVTLLTAEVTIVLKKNHVMNWVVDMDQT